MDDEQLVLWTAAGPKRWHVGRVNKACIISLIGCIISSDQHLGDVSAQAEAEMEDWLGTATGLFGAVTVSLAGGVVRRHGLQLQSLSIIPIDNP